MIAQRCGNTQNHSKQSSLKATNDDAWGNEMEFRMANMRRRAIQGNQLNDKAAAKSANVLLVAK